MYAKLISQILMKIIYWIENFYSFIIFLINCVIKNKFILKKKWYLIEGEKTEIHPKSYIMQNIIFIKIQKNMQL